MRGLLCSLLCLGSLAICAQEDVAVRVLYLPRHVQVNDRLSLVVEMSAAQPMSRLVWMTVELPAHWEVISKKLPTTVAGLKSAKFSYVVRVGRQTQAGKQEIKAKVFKRGLESYVQTFETEVVKIRRVEITAVNIPPYVKEGQTLRTEYVLQNRGNAPEVLILETSRGGIESYFAPITLKVNESRQVVVVQEIPITEGASWLASSDLKATPADSTQPIFKVVTVPVFNNKTKANDPYLRFPVEVGVWYNSVQGLGRGQEGVQFDVRGRGYVDLAKKQYVDFVAHGPNQSNLPILGAYDQYSLTYTNERNSISLGDYTLIFSKLMELSRFGRGFRYDHKGEKSGFSVLYQKPRFFPDITEIIGGNYVFKNKKNHDFSVNYLSKELIFNNQRFWTHMVGGSSLIKTPTLELENEVAVNYANQKMDVGLFSNLNYTGTRFRASNNLVYAGKDFYGFYNNGWQLNNALFYNLSRKFMVGLINNYNRLNPSLDLLMLNSSPYYKNNTAELTYHIDRRSRLVLNLTHQYKEDRQPIKKFNFKEDYARLMYFYNTNTYHLWLDGQYGYAHNLLVSSDNAQRQFSTRFMLQNEFYVTPSLSLGTNGEYLKTSKFSSSNTPSEYVFYGGTVRYHYRKTFDLNLTYRNNFAPDELIERRDFFDMQANLRLGQHQFSAVGTQTFIPGFTEQNTLIMSLRYRYLFNFKVAKHKNLGTIKAQVTGRDDIPKGGMVFQLGSQKYLTDANGSFTINNLIPNKYTLNLARSSVGMGIVPTIPVPIEVEVKADSTLTLLIPFTQSGSIAGTVVFEKNAQTGADDDDKTKPTVLLKLNRDQESLLTTIDENGAFSFKEITPGEWTLSATLLGDETKYTVAQPRRKVLIQAQQLQRQSFVVKPLVRTIHFDEQSILISSK